MKQLSKNERQRLSRLAPALEARKNADMAAFAEARARCDEIEDQIQAIHAALSSAAERLNTEDLAERANYESWRVAQRERLKKLADALHAAEDALEERRQELVRSNGEVEALKRLIEPPDA